MDKLRMLQAIERRLILLIVALALVMVGCVVGEVKYYLVHRNDVVVHVPEIQPLERVPSTSTTTTVVAPTTTTTEVPVTTVPPTTVPEVTTTTVAAPVVEEAPVVVSSVSLEDAFVQAVPAVWRNAIPVSFEIIDGNGSYSVAFPARIQVGRDVLSMDSSVLKAVLAHEFGHRIGYDYGMRSPTAAPPEGFPGVVDKEVWAECVATVFTGRWAGYGPCAAADLEFTTQWLAAGPAAHTRYYSAPVG